MTTHDHHENHDRHLRHGGHHVDFESPEAAAYAELEGEVLAGMVRDATERLARRADQHGVHVRRVLDLGCGPGIAACQLAERFPSADVLAIDGSAAMLEKANARAGRFRLADRVRTRRADFPGGLDELGAADVVWASMVLHHIGDETDALRRIRRLLPSNGLLAVVERAEPLRVEPAHGGSGRSGLWDRLDAAWQSWFAEMRDALPGATTSDDYPAMLDAAGFELLADDVLAVTLEPPLDERTCRFARLHLERSRTQLARHADAADIDALDAVLGDPAGESVLRRGEVRLRATRRLYVGTPVR